MDTSIVNTFILSAMGLVVLLAGFLAKNWFMDQSKTSEKLASAIERLTDFIDRVERVQDLHGFKIEQIEKEIALMNSPGAMGRRRQDHCRVEECPLEGARPGMTRETD
jgi:hypothetical protein